MQRYQPPHARRAQGGHSSTSTSTSIRPDRAPRPSPSPSEDGPSYHPSRTGERRTAVGAQSLGPTPVGSGGLGQLSSGHRGGMGTRQERPLSNAHSRSTDSPGTSSNVNAIRHDRYTPRPSRKDWSAPPGGDTGPTTSTQFATPGIGAASERSGQSARDRAREMEMLQSVSRSGGDGADGDALKNWETQERYRVYIDERIEAHYTNFPGTRETPPRKDATEELESLSSLVLLFRKLREGVVASGRIDGFAIEVFESSALFAILASSRPQLVSALSGLVPGLYTAYDPTRAARQRPDRHNHHHEKELPGRLAGLTIDRRAEFASLLLLYQLVVLGPKDFWTTYFELTSPTRHRRALRNRFDSSHEASSSSSSSSLTQAPEGSPIDPDPSQRSPFVRPSQLAYARKAASSLAAHTFSPLAYFELLEARAEAGGPYERHILGWARDGVRERAWQVLRKGYMSCPLRWAGTVLGLRSLAEGDQEVRRWVDENGAGTRIDDGVLRLR